MSSSEHGSAFYLVLCLLSCNSHHPHKCLTALISRRFSRRHSRTMGDDHTAPHRPAWRMLPPLFCKRASGPPRLWLAQEHSYETRLKLEFTSSDPQVQALPSRVQEANVQCCQKVSLVLPYSFLHESLWMKPVSVDFVTYVRLRNLQWSPPKSTPFSPDGIYRHHQCCRNPALQLNCSTKQPIGAMNKRATHLIYLTKRLKHYG